MLQPHIGHHGVTQLSAYSAYGDTPLSVAWGMVTHPLELWSNVFNRENFQLLVYLFAPVLFLPFLSPRYLLPVVPLQVLYLAGTVPPETRYGPQAVAITAFIFLATPMGLAGLGRRSVEQVTVDRRVLITMLAASLSFYVLLRAQLALRAAVGLGWPAMRSTAPGWPPATPSARTQRVRASPSMLIVLAQRRVLYPLDGLEADAMPPKAPTPPPPGVSTW